MTLDAAADDFRVKTYDVFVSYKHNDGHLRDVLVEALEAAKLFVWWDAKLVSGAWRSQLADRINNCKLVVALWSKQVAEAPDEVRDEMSAARALDRLLLVRTDSAEIPKLFSEQNFMLFDGWMDPAKCEIQLDAIMAEVRRRVAKPRYQVVETGKAQVVSTLVMPPEFGDIPGAPDKLIGRDAELSLLRNAWASQPPKKVNAVVLHGLGGAGKSALLRTFANELLASGGAGAKRIYGWSAYSQGSGEQKRADSDAFISKALKDFGWQGELPSDPIERARSAAQLIQKESVLLLLDGLEPLQDSPSINKGRFKDKGIVELIKWLAGQNAGLMVLTTRQEVPELQGFGPVVTNHELDQLSDRAGADLLLELGVRGHQWHLEAAVRDVQGHALSVTLLGTYLAEVCGGDIRYRDRFNFTDIVLSPEEQSALLTDNTIIPAKRAAKVMRGYLNQFEKLAKEHPTAGLGGPESALLHLLGLFDRPADGPAVDALLRRHIPGLTDELLFKRTAKIRGWLFKSRKIELEPLHEIERLTRLREAKNRLRKLRLISNATRGDPHELDAHPVARAFFAGLLKETLPEAAKAAHDILYHHYAAAAPELPDTLEDMQPLFLAVQHGVKAGRVREVFEKIFMARLERGNKDYMCGIHGAFGPNLAVMANFFETPWQTPCRELKEEDRAWLLSAVASALTALGRLSDSIEPGRVALEVAMEKKHWRNAARAGGRLVETVLRIGDVPRAVRLAEQAIAHADRSGSAQERELRRANLAVALTAAGNLDLAAALFAEAESLMVFDREAAQLYSLRGYQYGDLILARHGATYALARGLYQLDVARRYYGMGLGLEDIGYAHLLIGRAQDAMGEREAAISLDAAVAGLRKAGTTHILPEALLARAAYRRRRAAAGETGLIEPLCADFAEVADIAGEEMRLHLTDLALAYARFALAVPAAFANPRAARAEAEYQTDIATNFIAATGYHRRDAELAELRTRLVSTSTDRQASGRMPAPGR